VTLSDDGYTSKIRIEKHVKMTVNDIRQVYGWEQRRGLESNKKKLPNLISFPNTPGTPLAAALLI
jgi:hypothetical protein